MTAERSQIQFGLTSIPFLIRRSSKRATVALTIENDGGLVVTAPAAVSEGLPRARRCRARAGPYRRPKGQPRPLRRHVQEPVRPCAALADQGVEVELGATLLAAVAFLDVDAGQGVEVGSKDQ